MTRLFITYMEQLAPPFGEPLQAPETSVNVQQESLGIDDYLDLYRAVGGPLNWDERLMMSLDALASFLTTPATAVYILRQNGHPLGLCEFEQLLSSEIELKHFGLVPEAHGRRLGPYLLDSALRTVWAQKPRRIWLHTDTNDHPKAKSTYERSGFRIYREAWETFPD